MTQFSRFIGVIGTILMMLWDIVEFLAAPALFVVIGVLNGFPWQYYAIALGGYVALFILIEVIAHFIFKALNKKIYPPHRKKTRKIRRPIFQKRIIVSWTPFSVPASSVEDCREPIDKSGGFCYD